jgi:Putative zinc-finger
MDHEEAVRQKATERYLLDELDPEIRDQFEDHLFDCEDCALDVRAAAMLVEQSKVILAEPVSRSAMKRPAAAPAKAGLFAWLRPSLAVPVFAVLLAVIAYQNFVTYPKLTAAANQPQIGPWASVNVSTRGTTPIEIKTHSGEGFGLLVNLPPDTGFVSYAVELYNPTGKLEWSGPLSAESGDPGRQIYIPGRNRLPGIYTLAVRGIDAAGESKEISRNSIDLEVQH